MTRGGTGPGADVGICTGEAGGVVQAGCRRSQFDSRVPTVGSEGVSDNSSF